MNSSPEKIKLKPDWLTLGTISRNVLLAVGMAISVSLFTGCQTTRPWFDQIFNKPVSRSTESGQVRSDSKNKVVPPEMHAHDRQTVPNQEKSLDYRMADGSMQSTAHQQHELLQASFQDVQNPAQSTGSQSPHVGSSAAAAAPPNPPQHSSVNQQQLAVPGNQSQGFHPRELSYSATRSATEMVVEMATEIRLMREELNALKSTVNYVRNENAELQRQRDDLKRRVANLEQQLHLTRNAEQEMTSRFEALQRYLNEFSRSRQQQIKDLTAIVDLLEEEVRKNQ